MTNNQVPADVQAYLENLPVEALKEVGNKARQLAKEKRGQLDQAALNELNTFILARGGYDQAKRYWAAMRKHYDPPKPRAKKIKTEAAPAPVPAVTATNKKATNGKERSRPSA